MSRRQRRRTYKGGWIARFKRAPRWIEVSAAAVGLIIGLSVIAKFLLDNGEHLLAHGSAESIEVQQVVVVNGPMHFAVVEGGLLQSANSTPHLDITVRNRGKQAILLTGLHVKIVDSAQLGVCRLHTGDAVPVSRTYAQELPILPLPWEKEVTHPLHQVVLPGQVDRFKVLFRTPDRGGNYVYALQAGLLTDASHDPVALGRFVLGVPESVPRGGRFLPEGPRPFGVLNEHERLLSTWCARRNMASLNRVLGQPGERSAAMSALAGVPPADWWNGFADPRPPRAAVRALLRERFGEGPVLAVFAAEKTGDLRFQRQVSQGAAERELQEAQRVLSLGNSYAFGALIAAHYAYLFSPSQKAKDILRQAEAQQQIALQEQEGLIGEGAE